MWYILATSYVPVGFSNSFISQMSVLIDLWDRRKELLVVHRIQCQYICNFNQKIFLSIQNISYAD